MKLKMRLKLTLLSLLFPVAFWSVVAQIPGTPEEHVREVKIPAKYIPEVFGAVKAKFETSLYDGKHRFNVRNSRFGVKGLAGERMRYVIQIDFSNEGKVSVLDSYVAYFHRNFEISIGQQQYHFSTDLDRGPNSNIFANRSFLSKFVTTYYGSTLDDGVEKYYVSSIGGRDLGLHASYSIPGIPVKLSGGVFNGSGTNSPEWDDKVNFVGRVEIGGKKGFRFAASHYNGHTPVNIKVFHPQDIPGIEEEFTQRIRMWGGELHYGHDNFRIEAEYAQRRLKDDGLQLLHVAHVLGNYTFGLNNPRVFKYIMPVGRWDMGKNIEFLNRSKELEKFDAHRATLGVNLGFAGKIFGSELRFQFEKYMLDGKPSDYGRNPLLQDKFTVEVVVTF